MVVAPPPSECVCGGEEADTFRFVTFRFVTFCFCAEAVAFRAAAGHAPFRPLYDGRSSVVISGHQ